jgi:hypothetical protein
MAFSGKEDGMIYQQDSQTEVLKIAPEFRRRIVFFPMNPDRPGQP